MNVDWYYKAVGEEHGPVSLERLKEMARKNQLLPQDSIRAAETGDWVAARTVSELFPNLQPGPQLEDASQVEELDELDIDSFQVVSDEQIGSNHPTSEQDLDLSELVGLANLEDLDIQVSDAPTVGTPAGQRLDAYGSPIKEELAHESTQPNPTQVQVSVEEPAALKPEDQWICQLLGVQLGPMPLEDLRDLAKHGEVGLDDDVRRLDRTRWQKARTVEGLFPGFSYESQSESDSVSAPAPVVNPSANGGSAPQVRADPPRDSELADQSESNKPAAEPPKPKPPSKPKRKKAAKPKPKPAAPEPKSMDEWLSDAVPSSETNPAADPVSETEPAKEPVAEVPQESAPEEAAEDPAAKEREAQLQAQYQAQAARIEALNRQQTGNSKPKGGSSSDSGGSALGEQFAEGWQKLKENPKILVIFGLLLLVAGIMYFPWSLFSTSDQDFLDEIVQIGNKFEEMRTKKATGELAKFKTETEPLLKDLQSRLTKAGAGTRDRPKQELLFACTRLEKMLGEGFLAKKSEAHEDYDEHIANARALMNGQPLPGEVEEGIPSEANSAPDPE